MELLIYIRKEILRAPLPFAGKGAFLLFLVVFLAGCFEERFTHDENDVLAFSTDTLSFDTVLTQVSTVTRLFKVYNPNDLSVRIDEIQLVGTYRGFFRLNVDGYTGDIIRDVTIRANDSIYVFVESTIDPDQPASVSPYIIEAEVSFLTNNQDQRVTLVAWGQNANYIPGPNMPNRLLVLSCNLGEVRWDDPRPYVIYGTLFIDSCTLVIPPGTRIYVHGGIANNELGIFNEGLLYTLPQGKFRVEGTVEQPVIFRDDRIEPDYEGEWAGIRLGSGSGPHQFSHMQVTNAIAGIVADSASVVNIDHSIFSFMGGPGFLGRHAKATLSNCLFYGNSGQAIALTYGGEYDIIHCTLASYGSASEAMALNNFYCPDPPLCQSGFFLNKLEAEVVNCIIVGSSTDEINLVDASPEGSGLFDIQFRNTIFSVDKVWPDLEPFTSQCLRYTFSDTVFVDLHKHDYHLDSLSVAIMRGMPIPDIADDLDGKPRDPETPDLGCYEW